MKRSMLLCLIMASMTVMGGNATALFSDTIVGIVFGDQYYAQFYGAQKRADLANQLIVGHTYRIRVTPFDENGGQLTS